jgi:membrane protein YdbS with pleckstrin-like domain
MDPTLKLSPSILTNASKYITDFVAFCITIVCMYIFREFETIVFVVGGVILVSIIVNVIHITLYIKTFRIVLTKDTLEFGFGVVYRKVETVEMHRINDFTKERGFMDRILGISNIVVYSSDVTTPKIVFRGLNKEQARVMVKFLQKYSSDSIVKHYLNEKNGKTVVSIGSDSKKPT